MSLHPAVDSGVIRIGMRVDYVIAGVAVRTIIDSRNIHDVKRVINTRKLFFTITGG